MENMQVLGFAQGADERQAFENLLGDNPWLLETSFGNANCIELRDPGHEKYWVNFSIKHKSDSD